MSNSSTRNMASLGGDIQKTAVEVIWTYVPPFIILFGIFSNTLAVSVLLRKGIRRSSAIFYFMILCFADLVILTTSFPVVWLKYANIFNIETYSNGCCKYFRFWMYFTTDFCNWILVAATIDRCAAVCFPFKSRKLCTFTAAKMTATSIGICMLLLNIHLFWGYSLSRRNAVVVCIETNAFTLYVWPWIDFCLYSFIPFLAMIISNTLIIRKVALSRNRIVGYDQPTNPGTSFELPLGNKRIQREVGKKRVQTMTRTLQIFNACFFVLTMPVVIWSLYYPHIPDHDRLVIQVSRAVVSILEFTNNILPLLLLLGMPFFRKEMQAMITIRRNNIQ